MVILGMLAFVSLLIIFAGIVFVVFGIAWVGIAEAVDTIRGRKRL